MDDREWLKELQRRQNQQGHPNVSGVDRPGVRPDPRDIQALAEQLVFRAVQDVNPIRPTTGRVTTRLDTDLLQQHLMIQNRMLLQQQPVQEESGDNWLVWLGVTVVVIVIILGVRNNMISVSPATTTVAPVIMITPQPVTVSVPAHPAVIVAPQPTPLPVPTAEPVSAPVPVEPNAAPSGAVDEGIRTSQKAPPPGRHEGLKPRYLAPGEKAPATP